MLSKLASVVAATGMFVFAAGSTATAAAAFEPRPLPFQRGVDLVDWGSDGYGQRGVETQLRQIKSHMGTSVTLVQTWSQDTLTSSSVRPGSHAVPDTRLVAAIRAARKMGLSVVLRPYIDVNGGLWRGRAKPLDRAAWFASYRNFALHYAGLARREKVSIFIFATEMVDLSIAAPDDWRALAAAVRSEFPGPVG